MDQVDFYVLCLTGIPERMVSVKKMQEVLPALVVSEAINAKDIPVSHIQHLKDTGFFVTRNGQHVDSLGRRYRQGALGIFLSHRTLLRTINNMSLKKPYAIIFEDDVALDPDFIPKLNHVVQAVKDIEFDMVTLHTMDFQKTDFKPVNGEAQLLRKCPGFCGLQCYLVRTDNMLPLLNVLQHFSDPIDEQISRHPTLNLMHFIGIEMVHEQRHVTSVSTQTGALPIYENQENHDRIHALRKASVSLPQPSSSPLPSQLIYDLLQPVLDSTCIMVHIKNPYTQQIISLCKDRMHVDPYHIMIGQPDSHTVQSDSRKVLLPFSIRPDTLKTHGILANVVFMMATVPNLTDWISVMTPGGFMYGDAVTLDMAKTYTSQHNILIMADGPLWCLRKPIL